MKESLGQLSLEMQSQRGGVTRVGGEYSSAILATHMRGWLWPSQGRCVRRRSQNLMGKQPIRNGLAQSQPGHNR